jgi:hypothetical protein
MQDAAAGLIPLFVAALLRRFLVRGSLSPGPATLAEELLNFLCPCGHVTCERHVPPSCRPTVAEDVRVQPCSPTGCLVCLSAVELALWFGFGRPTA